jgi:Cu/Ag efflux protein CusF
MLKRAAPLLMIFLMAASAAQAQYGGGGPGGGGMGGGGGRGGHGGGRGGHQQGGPRPTTPPAATAAKPFSQPEIGGVVKAIDAESGRITIAYEPVEALDWPAGTQPFAVSKSALLKDLTVGQKVRFQLESQQIAAIRPF